MRKLSDFEINNNFIEFLKNEGLTDKKEKIDAILRDYRSKSGSLIPVLQNIQQLIKYLPVPVQDYIAKGLDVPSSDVYGVISFYSFFTMKPRGEHVIRVCLGTACYVKGGGKIAKAIEDELKIKDGETTGDKKFSLQVVRCLGACGISPLMMVDDKPHGRLTDSEAVEIIKNIK